MKTLKQKCLAWFSDGSWRGMVASMNQASDGGSIKTGFVAVDPEKARLEGFYTVFIILDN